MSDQEVSFAEIPIPQNAEVGELLELLEGQIGNLHVQLAAERALKLKLQGLLALAQEEIRELRGTMERPPLRTVGTPPSPPGQALHPQMEVPPA